MPQGTEYNQLLNLSGKTNCMEKHRPSQGAAKQQTVSVVAGPLKVPYVLS